MTLPHPHGTSSGQIGHNAVIDTGNTPGSTGGKFVGFGEDGTSAIANRASWALSENIDYVYGKIAASLAIPDVENWTTAGGDGAAHQMAGSGSDQVWSGDAGYLPQTQLGRDKIVTLLSQSYHQLVDANGDKVVLKTIRNSTDTVDVFGTGFVTQPIIKFLTVNPVNNAVVTDPYTIPDGTVVRIVHARKTTVETLPTDTLTRMSIRTAEEISAGVFLQDGSRPMRGDIDMAAHNLANVATLYNESGSGNPLGLISDAQIYGQADDDITLLSTGGHINLTGGTSKDVFAKALSGNLKLQDARIGPLYLSKTTDPSTLIGQAITDSLRGRLGSDYRTIKGCSGNYFADPGAAAPLTFTDGTKTIAWTHLRCFVQGEFVNVAAGSFVVTPSVSMLLVTDRYGNVSEIPLADYDNSYTLIAAFFHNGSIFTSKMDLRRWADARSNSLSASVGADSGGYPIPGCDFSDLKQALEYLSILAAFDPATFGAGLASQVATVTLMSDTTLTAPITTFPCRVLIRGEGGNESTKIPVRVKVNHAIDRSTFEANGFPVYVDNVCFSWENGTLQNSDQGLFKDLGSGSVVRNCHVMRGGGSGTGGYANVVTATLTMSGDKPGLLFENCHADVDRRFVMGAGALTDNRVKHSTFRNCYALNDGASVSVNVAFDLVGDHNMVESCTVSDTGSGFYQGIRIGEFGRVLNCQIAGMDTGGGIQLVPSDSAPFNRHIIVKGNHVRNFEFGILITVPGPWAPNYYYMTVASNFVGMCVYGITIDNDVTACEDQSTFFIEGNVISDVVGAAGSPIPWSTGHAIGVKNAKTAIIARNAIRYNQLKGILVMDNTKAVVAHNDIEGFVGTAIEINALAVNPAHIIGNQIGCLNAGTTDTAISVNADWTVVESNTAIVGAGTCKYGVAVGSYNHVRIVNNYFSGFGDTGGNQIYAVNTSGTFKGGLLIQGNNFRFSYTATVAVMVAGFGGTRIENNYFAGGMYSAIFLINQGTSDINGSIIKGNAFVSVTGYVGPASDAVVVLVGASAAYSRNIQVEGNSFAGGGETSDVNSHLIYLVTGSGTVHGNTFNDWWGYTPDDTSTVTTACIRVFAGNWTVEGNKFHKDITSTMPRRTYVIESLVGGTVFLNNHLTLEGNLASLGTYGVFRFIRAFGLNDSMANNNALWHFPTSISAGSIAGIDFGTGLYCMANGNRFERYNLYCRGDSSVVCNNQLVNGQLWADGAHTTVAGNSTPSNPINVSGTVHAAANHDSVA